MTSLHAAIRSATLTLTEAGIDAPRADAEHLAAHLAGVERGQLVLLEPPSNEFLDRYRSLVIQRSKRVPVQHLTGTAAFGPLTLHVGPGVFTPRPETEAMLEWLCRADITEHLSDRPVIVDACTGSGALALALARHWPKAQVLGVDDSEEALAYARRNCADSTVELLRADVTQPAVLQGLSGDVDLLVSNPPYIPDGAELAPEVAHHDPSHALFGGPDGMTVIAALVSLAARLLRPGGIFAVEHDDTTSVRTVEVAEASGAFESVLPHRDLTGRDRFVTAHRRPIP